jgi:glc operon protein GlcG
VALALMLPLGTASAQNYGAPISLENAKKIIAAGQAEAKKNNWNMVISVIDTGGNLVALERMDGTQLGSIQVSQDKAHTALFFKRPSKAFQDLLGQGGDNIRYLAMNGVLPVDGGDLIVMGGAIVGAIGVSGASSAQDGQVAKAGAGAVK